MAGTEYQGAQIIGTMVGFNNPLATDEDFETLGWNIGWKHQHLRVEPQMFREKGSNAAGITFTEELTETNAEVIQVEILYEIYTSA